MLICSRYFLFHAALATLIPIWAGHDPQEVDTRMADIHTARKLFQQVLAGNPLAAQCADILNRLQPGNTLERPLNLEDIPTSWMGGISDFPTDPEVFFTSFGWDNNSTEF